MLPIDFRYDNDLEGVSPYEIPRRSPDTHTGYDNIEPVVVHDDLECLVVARGNTGSQ